MTRNSHDANNHPLNTKLCPGTVLSIRYRRVTFVPIVHIGYAGHRARGSGQVGGKRVDVGMEELKK